MMTRCHAYTPIITTLFARTTVNFERVAPTLEFQSVGGFRLCERDRGTFSVAPWLYTL